jgi:phage tail sheath protein FI
MPEYLHPGVYLEEIPNGPRPIEGVPTSTAAFLGEAERGSTKPRLVTSNMEYARWFGGAFGADKFLPDAISGFFENGGRRAFICRLVGKSATPAEATFGDFVVRAAGPGSWGKRIWARIDDSTGKNADGSAVGFRLRLAYWSDTMAPFDPFMPENQQMTPLPSIVEDFDDLVVEETSADFYGKRLPLVDVSQGDADPGPESSALCALVLNPGVAATARPSNGSRALLDGGADDDAPLGPDDYQGVPADARTGIQGLAALERDAYREVALVYAPNVAKEIALKIVSHCEAMRFRFAVLDCERGQSSIADIDPRTSLADTQYAAFYYPWLVTADPDTSERKVIPPGGHVLGVYARTDTERGVFKAPANATLRGVLDLEYDIGDDSQDLLNPRGVNVIRRFSGRGIRVWGARTLSSDAEWKYVSVGRLFVFLERSIYAGTQWVVFEPNDSQLWSRVTDTIRLFLRAQWQSGALQGRTEEEAFFVACNETVMSQDDILNGRLICEIGVASIRPAEFVIFRIFQSTAEAGQVKDKHKHKRKHKRKHRKVVIVVQDESGDQSAGAAPIKVEPGDLNGKGNDVMIEELELSNEGIERVK